MGPAAVSADGPQPKDALPDPIIIAALNAVSEAFAFDKISSTLNLELKCSDNLSSFTIPLK